jgi:hypothetical protein
MLISTMPKQIEDPRIYMHSMHTSKQAFFTPSSLNAKDIYRHTSLVGLFRWLVYHRVVTIALNLVGLFRYLAWLWPWWISSDNVYHMVLALVGLQMTCVSHGCDLALPLVHLFRWLAYHGGDMVLALVDLFRWLVYHMVLALVDLFRWLVYHIGFGPDRSLQMTCLSHGFGPGGSLQLTCVSHGPGGSLRWLVYLMLLALVGLFRGLVKHMVVT